jgi:beta-glucosidase
VTPDTSRARRGAIRRGATAATAALLACSALTIIAATTAGGAQAATSTGCPWVGSRAPIATRVRAVLGQMTLDDKLAMVDGVGYSSGTAGYVGSVGAPTRTRTRRPT